MTSGRDILEIAFRRTGATHHQDSRVIEFLEKDGLRLHNGFDDLPLFTIYEDITTKERLLARCECVIAGRRTLRAFPGTAEFGVHVRKTYVPDAPPIRRGETPQVEFERTLRARNHLDARQSGWIRPLGYEPLVFRSRLIPGMTFAALSPFKEVRETQAAGVKMSAETSFAFSAQLNDLYRSVGRLHAAGLAHGDLHMENVLWVGGEDGYSVPIDFAACVFREEVSPVEWQEAVFEDKREILREAAFMQLSIGLALPTPVFKEAQQMAEVVLIPALAKQVAQLRVLDIAPAVPPKTASDLRERQNPHGVISRKHTHGFPRSRILLRSSHSYLEATYQWS